MQVIGLIGGLSWESTAEYYRLINEEVHRRLGGSHSARIILYSLDFQEVHDLQHQGRWEEAENSYPLRRAIMPEDVAATALWLIDSADTMTGEWIRMDVGRHLS